MKKSLLILLFTCWALFFAAFRPVMPFAAETAAFPDGTPATGGRILMGTIGEPSNLIPYMASDSASGEITGLLYVAPLKYDKDLNVVPWAAASYEVLEGGRLLRFVLREDHAGQHRALVVRQQMFAEVKKLWLCAAQPVLRRGDPDGETGDRLLRVGFCRLRPFRRGRTFFFAGRTGAQQHAGQQERKKSLHLRTSESLLL